jgi:hypothetical protein
MRKVQIVTIFVLIFFNLFLLYRIKGYISINDQLYENNLKLISYNSFNENQIKILKNYMIIAKYSENISIKKEILISNEKGKFKLDKIIDNGFKLVLRYTELNCQSCVDTELSSLQNLANKIGMEKIVILASYKNNEDLIKFKRLNKLKLPMYNVDSLSIPLENMNIPFYFICDKEFKTKLVFIPKKEISNLTVDYLKLVEKIFKENNTIRHLHTFD